MIANGVFTFGISTAKQRTNINERIESQHPRPLHAPWSISCMIMSTFLKKCLPWWLGYTDLRKTLHEQLTHWFYDQMMQTKKSEDRICVRLRRKAYTQQCWSLTIPLWTLLWYSAICVILFMCEIISESTYRRLS